MNKIKIFLIISICFNIFIFVLGTGYVIKKGGITYLKQKIETTPTKKTFKSSIYEIRKDIFYNSPQKDGIVMLGDSLTNNNEWGEYLKNKNVLNRGISGDSTEGILNRMSSVIKLKPSKIFIMIGINDLGIFKIRDKTYLNNYQKIIKKIKSGSPKSKIYIESLLPINQTGGLQYSRLISNSQIVKNNTKLKQISEKYNCKYIDLYSKFVKNGQLPAYMTIDGLHIKGLGYKIWAKELTPYVK